MRASPPRLLLAGAALLFALPVLYGLTLDPLEASLRNGLRPPGLAYPFGTDQLGRDVLARIGHAFLLDLGLAGAIMALSSCIGLAAGLAAGECGGRLDAGLVFVMDVLSALPQIVVALIFAAHLGGGAGALILALGLTGWVKYARITRAATGSLRETEFVMAARLVGNSPIRVLWRHILPHILPLLGGLMALQFGHTILTVAALGFLGLGIQPPTPEWGAMLAEARPYLGRAPWLAFFPGLFVFGLTLLALIAGRLAWGRRGTPDPL